MQTLANRALVEDGRGSRACGHWVGLIRDLPDLRWSKVMNARRRIRERLYDRAGPLEAILPPLADDVAVMLGRGSCPPLS